jgi:integrase
MATLFKRGAIWWIQHREGGRQVRESLATTNRKVAEELRVQREAKWQRERLAADVGGAAVGGLVAVEREPEPERAPRSLALAAIRAEYEAWSLAHKRAKTIRNDKARLSAFLATLPASVELASIRTADVERFLTAEAAKGRQPATLLRHREILHAFWRWALRQGHVERNVVSDIPRPRLPERDPRFLSLDQVDALLAAVAGDGIAPLIATAVFAGLRREELCWLTVDDVELDREPGILRVRAKTVGSESWQPKTKRDRKVPISTRLRAVLVAHRATLRRGAVWLFPSPQGARWDPDNVSRKLRDLLRPAGAPWGFLDLRHTFGSQLARKGVSLLKIARLMGNSPAIASRHYINLVPEEMAGDVEF